MPLSKTPPSADDALWTCPVTGELQRLRVERSHSTDSYWVNTAKGNFRLDQPLRLKPITIPKPWGEEIWYTGSEKRGESRVEGDSGALPLAAFLALDPAAVTAGLPLVLLKVLVSDPVPGRGELYLEVHREKAEAYLVTALDAGAWPTGQATMRYGIRAEVRRRYATDDALRAALADAASKLEAEPARVEYRQALDAFFDTLPLTPGSHILSPPGIPHSLPHGVRIVEFQTPTYERLILAASQPVVTQERWDSQTAAQILALHSPSRAENSASQSEPTELPAGHRQLAAFNDFGARQLELGSEPLRLPVGSGAAVALCTRGVVRLGDITLAEEQAVLIPAAARTKPLALAADGDRAEIAIAAPDL
ncbi:MAG: hypothetical protein AAF918_03135 [Pseudomonadota bacterium]